MQNYEFMLIIDPSLSKDDNESIVVHLKELLESNSVKITKEDVWGEKKLAYKINKSDKAYYILYYIETENTGALKELTKEINLEKRIWRHIFVKTEV